VPTQRSSFDKLQRERAKKEKAAAKRERRAERSANAGAPDDPVVIPSGDGELSPAELMRLVEDLHTRYAAGGMELEDFEEAKAELMARLTVD
jgi:hypothetical protein